MEFEKETAVYYLSSQENSHIGLAPEEARSQKWGCDQFLLHFLSFISLLPSFLFMLSDSPGTQNRRGNLVLEIRGRDREDS